MASLKTRSASKTNGVGQSLLEWPTRPAQTRVISNPYDLMLNTASILLVILIVIYIAFLFSFNGRATKDVPGIESFLRQFASVVSALGCALVCHARAIEANEFQSPTAVPILFAFIVGRAIKTFAHWRLHHGERIGKLDLLYGSTTVISTMTTIFDYGEFSIFAAFLIIAWTLSPLGAQSALRVLSFRAGSELSSKTLPYYNVSSPFPDTFQNADFGTYSAPVIALFLSSLGAPDTTKQSSMDTWGNVKIPVLELLPGYKGTTSADWITINKTQNGSDAPIYSSLIGIPIAGVPSTKNSTFTIETSYMNFDCDTLEKVLNVTEKENEIAAISADCDPTGNFTCQKRMSWGITATIPYPEGRTNATARRCNDSNPSTARQILYLGKDPVGISNATYAKCSVNTTFVEVQIECVGWDCASTAMRPSLATNPGPNNTIFDGQCDWVPNMYPYYMQLLDWVTKMQTASSYDVTIVQGYLFDPEHALNTTALYSQNGLYTVAKSDFSLRYAQIINTYWLAMSAANALFLGHPSNYKALRESIDSGALDTMYFGETNATTFSAVTNIRCDFGWLIPLILTTLLMWTAAMLTMAVDLKLGVPRMLMNITTMTRGNPNFGLPPGGGGLPDETRGRLIRDVKVRFGSVEGNDPDDLVVGACVEGGGSVSMTRRKQGSVVEETSV